ncbi:hypothetical protein [Thermomonas fusca]|uniref:DUF3887 domain-containing protein n=1 Tax=Thermomonas fusca TaxID=215690 RepID=A0A5R9PC59_9GAMM|nr:hypothetical protein [Thermomonas fusca]TLX20677.1 hypothetical protein E5S66_13380 [Thermomonas fusca]
MKKIIALLLLTLAMLTTGNTFAKDKSENGVYRPTLSTNPKKYLREFQLNKATPDEIIQYVGAPDKTYSLGGSDFITYNLATQKGGIIEYTFEVKDDLVVNVTYLNSGNFFGVTQRESAKQLQSP